MTLPVRAVEQGKRNADRPRIGLRNDEHGSIGNYAISEVAPLLQDEVVNVIFCKDGKRSGSTPNFLAHG